MSNPAKPKAVLVFDVNVLIDAMDISSRNHLAALSAITENTELPTYISDTLLQTTSNKLMEFGADRKSATALLEMLLEDDGFTPPVHTLRNVPVTDYELIDRYGNSDYEDSTVISLMDAAEKDAQAPAVLVTNDTALRDWCHDNRRLAIRPSEMAQFLSNNHSSLRPATFEYLARHMFPDGAQRRSSTEAKTLANEIVSGVLQKQNARRPEPRGSTPHPQAAQVYKRFPELNPENRPEFDAPENALFQP
ncbi:hypothetical protein [Arthrobacter bambusae]|uniref:Nucleic acid-binding protein n=1 Tax=Arthrobacter bambusae TaxID=1338426 RepID=A0AAW8DCX7_9MICC|nr:hypothetical protein [Arthrobacter bambusae]MDP9903145.1 putative nucleic acid-binding protein [Arthrobacter bambusae]MDQ0128861.1 putative nucleic acid-binding protein [Arthrobacter bambusae]MDQ0180202.1 putative nucleic acid-binding protein [Arthrobacter bambusae]